MSQQRPPRKVGHHRSTRRGIASAAAYLATLAASVAFGAVAGRALTRMRARGERAPDVVCGGCDLNLGNLNALRSPYRRAAVLAHLSVCQELSEETRVAASTLTAADLAPLDWARLRQEVAGEHTSGGPHRDPDTIHPLGACQHCDQYPTLQATRARENATSPNPRRQE